MTYTTLDQTISALLAERGATPTEEDRAALETITQALAYLIDDISA